MEKFIGLFGSRFSFVVYRLVLNFKDLFKLILSLHVYLCLLILKKISYAKN